MVLILVRHGKSTWNKENKFTGLMDIDLCNKGIIESKKCSEIIKNIDIDICFTSDLIITKRTALIIKKELKSNFEIISNKKLQERDYGDLTGVNKDECIKKYGIEKVRKWRRSYYERPPNGENLDDVVKRVGIYFDENIKPLLDSKKNILIVAHGNSLRALMVHLNKKDINNIEEFEFNTCNPYFII